MKKDKEWLKEELLRDLMRLNGNPNMTDYELGIASGISTAINLTEKLDEQEITFEQTHDKLREESILSEKSFDYYWNCINDNVEIDEPGNILVPKQYKPVIPQFMADYIEKWKYEGLIMHEWFTFDHDDQDEDKVSKWLYDNDDETNKRREFVLIDAIRYGYEVEKEKLYIVVIPHPSGWASKLILHKGYNNEYIFEEEGDPDYEIAVLTEAKIKRIDRRFWTFAEEVKE